MSSKNISIQDKVFHKKINPSTPSSLPKVFKNKNETKQKLAAATTTCENRMLRKHFRVFSFLPNDIILREREQSH